MKIRTLLTILQNLDPDTEIFLGPDINNNLLTFDEINKDICIEELYIRENELVHYDVSENDKMAIALRGIKK